MTTHIVIARDEHDNDAYTLDTDAEVLAARIALRAAGLESAPIYAGEPDGEGDSYLNGNTLFAATVASVAEALGMSEDDECEPDGIDWGYTSGPAEGAPVFLVGGWYADDGNAEVHYEHAESGREAAEEYVSDGDWGDDSSTGWVRVNYWQECVSVGDEGKVIRGKTSEGSHKVTIEAQEPECSHKGGHDWQSPHEILGGLEENPGVWGHGGGVVIHEICAHCGQRKITDTWAQDMTDGEQGLTSVSYSSADDCDDSYDAHADYDV
jgi:hypothetical protein